VATIAISWTFVSRTDKTTPTTCMVRDKGTPPRSLRVREPAKTCTHLFGLPNFPSLCLSIVMPVGKLRKSSAGDPSGSLGFDGYTLCCLSCAPHDFPRTHLPVHVSRLIMLSTLLSLSPSGHPESPPFYLRGPLISYGQLR
jgi:hypothetical protein